MRKSKEKIIASYIYTYMLLQEHGENFDDTFGKIVCRTCIRKHVYWWRVSSKKMKKDQDRRV